MRVLDGPLSFGGSGGGEPAVTVATMNVAVGGADADAVVAMVREHQVDVLAVMELTDDDADALADAGAWVRAAVQRGDGRAWRPGTGLWSRFDLTNSEDVPSLFAHAIRPTVAGSVWGSLTCSRCTPRRRASATTTAGPPTWSCCATCSPRWRGR